MVRSFPTEGSPRYHAVRYRCDCDSEAMQCDSQRDRKLPGWDGSDWSTTHRRTEFSKTDDAKG
jgi:hypothetical protein